MNKKWGRDYAYVKYEVKNASGDFKVSEWNDWNNLWTIYVVS